MSCQPAALSKATAVFARAAYAPIGAALRLLNATQQKRDGAFHTRQSPLLTIELARESVDLAATGQSELRDMRLKQPLIGVCPARCATAMVPALRPIGDRQTFGACCDLTLDDAE